LSGTGSASTSNQVSLTWNAPATSSDPVVGYNIYRAVGSGSAQLVNPSVNTQTGFVDTSVTSGTTYGYYVTSVDKSGVQSVPSNQVSVTVGSVSGTPPPPTSHQVNLTWNAPSSSSDPVVGYNIYRSVGSGSAQLVNSSVNTPTSFVDTSVTSGTTYGYYVTSVDQSGVQSVPSNQISVSIP